jgi:DNA polymerase-3 subunit delta'
MAFKNFPSQTPGIELLQRSVKRGRLAHAYLFIGDELADLEALARTLAKTLNCLQPVIAQGVAVDSCDQCLSCRKIDHENHADVHWVRPESRSRVITTPQMRSLMGEIQLKPTEAEYKVAVVVAADRLRIEAANAFLKTLEEPPPKSVLILLTTEPQRILETVLSRCLRLSFSGDGPRPLGNSQQEWLKEISKIATADVKSLLGRYRLLDVVLRELSKLKEGIQEGLSARSPLNQYKHAEKEYIDKWEDELAAAIESEYRRQRADLLMVLHWWLRDVWLRTLPSGSRSSVSRPEDGELLRFPELDGTRFVAERISSRDALANLETIEQMQRWLGTNVQEGLALEVGLLKLRL